MLKMTPNDAFRCLQSGERSDYHDQRYTEIPQQRHQISKMQEYKTQQRQGAVKYEG